MVYKIGSTIFTVEPDEVIMARLDKNTNNFGEEWNLLLWIRDEPGPYQIFLGYSETVARQLFERVEDDLFDNIKTLA